MPAEPARHAARAVLRAALAGFVLSFGLPAAACAETLAIAVTSRPLERFLPGSDRRVFGRLEFLGGIVFSSRDPLLGAISSIRLRKDGENFVAVLDTGHWLTGRITRNAEGRLNGLADLNIRSMIDDKGRRENAKSRMDAEGLAIGRGELLVSYEFSHRIDAYPDPGFMDARPIRRLPFPFPKREMRNNRGLETIAVSPENGPLGAVAVTVAERSLDADGNLLAAILDGPMAGAFAVRRNDPWDATDGAFLPDGDLLLLERRFRLADGVGMRIRRIDGKTIRPGAVVDGEVLIDADLSHQIDNMEGLDVVSTPDGDTRIVIVSDDNHSILQRNLMLEFRLLPAGK
ncbi:esterase-like activity of phytase family protein [Shinella daejeonensis]|uniref:esterase-like activity of phytase family protein n=1 Tax=Shinella daejeonensis TaxID=659017 RepID=UPI0020C78D6C|nr:esterase-like activity of phytase family protein [Shinella daejeonensis]